MHDLLIYVRHFYYMLKVALHVLSGLLIVLLVSAGIVAIAEGMSYGKALYFTAITGLAVGYGDIAPTTVMGRIVSVMVGIIGLILFSIIIAVANAALRHMIEEKRDERKSTEHAAKKAVKLEAEQAPEQPAAQPGKQH